MKLLDIEIVDFSDFQDNIKKIFFHKDNNRDYYLNVIWYLEELLELLLEIYNISDLFNYENYQNINDNFNDNLAVELSDNLAWIFSVLNLNDIKIDKVFVIKSSLDNFTRCLYNLIYFNLYFIKALRKKDLKNIRNSAYLIIFFIIKICKLLGYKDLDFVFSRYSLCPKCLKEKCVC